jgi:hypothetical protein
MFLYIKKKILTTFILNYSHVQWFIIQHGIANVTLHNRLARTQNHFDLNNLSVYKTSYYFKGQKMFILFVGLLHIFVIPHNALVSPHSTRTHNI